METAVAAQEAHDPDLMFALNAVSETFRADPLRR